VIELAKIRWATEKLRDATEFMSNFEVFGERISLAGVSVNDLIAGEDRTIADIFDFTGEFPYLRLRLCLESPRQTFYCLLSNINRLG
jgi:hypothetical protein